MNCKNASLRVLVSAATLMLAAPKALSDANLHVITPDTPSNILVELIEKRRSEIERRLSSLDASQSQKLRAPLAHIEDAEDAARNGNKLTYEQALSLASELDFLSNRVFMITQTDRLKPLVQFDANGGRQIAVTDIPLL